MFSEKVSMWGQHWVDMSDILHDVLHCPQVGVLAAGSRALPETGRAWKSKSADSNETSGISPACTVMLHQTFRCDPPTISQYCSGKEYLQWLKRP